MCGVVHIVSCIFWYDMYRMSRVVLCVLWCGVVTVVVCRVLLVIYVAVSVV